MEAPNMFSFNFFGGQHVFDGANIVLGQCRQLLLLILHRITASLPHVSVHSKHRNHRALGT